MVVISTASRVIVACNIYVSAGGTLLHRDLLLRLLTETQEHCRRSNKNETQSQSTTMKEQQRVAVVHAFRDGPYDRSSFHLAGSPALVADVGSSLAGRAIRSLSLLETNCDNDEKSDDAMTGMDGCDASHPQESNTNETIEQRHPTVGLVDHVSVLPLKDEAATSITGSVARDIGEAIKALGADVLYYGRAHPSGKELAAVRRESTRFFESSKSNSNSLLATVSTKAAGQVTVGAPPRFVENYNIRLQPNVGKKIARTLTESVRERSGRGLPSVEALTLKYGQDQYEVACNLLDPTVTSSKDIENRMRLWEKQQQRQNEDTEESLGLIETAYRVGTTTDMCLEALREVSTEDGEIAHNNLVLKRLETDFLIK